ncbi:transcriptional regulator MntR [Exiguobacterium sp. J17977]|uniref:transcriptional regulator MntR n=3 Tax=Exiguobacterium TaxID=33986 RepID=UPI001BE5E262|nr:transcriptional regulator MntR [Exiguobacterium sp. J17977]
MPTPSMEDYLERIYLLMVEKGYARVSDIAEHLGVHPSSVTKMVQKLDREDYLIYEKYRGLMLTNKGQKIGKRLVERHAMLESFLRLIGVDEAHVYEDVEGIEHHLSSNTLDCMTQFVEFFEDKPELMAQFHAFQELNRTEDE